MFQVLPVEQFGYDLKWLTSYMFPKIWCPLLEMALLYLDFNAFLYAQGETRERISVKSVFKLEKGAFLDFDRVVAVKERESLLPKF